MLKERYHWSLRLLHWAMAIAILGLIASGWIMSEIPENDPDKFALYPWHKSFGMTILFLAFLRLGLRAATQVPPLPITISAQERSLAHIGHGLLYAFMFGIPVTGYVMSMAGGFGVKWFGIPLPNLIGADKPLGSLMHDFHGILPYLLLGLIGLHALGALKHQFFDTPENRVLRRMWF